MVKFRFASYSFAVAGSELISSVSGLSVSSGIVRSAPGKYTVHTAIAIWLLLFRGLFRTDMCPSYFYGIH